MKTRLPLDVWAALWAMVTILALTHPAPAQWQVDVNKIPLGKGAGKVGFGAISNGASPGTLCLVNTVPPTFASCPSPTVITTVITQPSHGQVIYQNFDAVINRLNDRTLGGGATVNDGLYPNVTKDWLETLVPNTTQLATWGVLNPMGYGYGFLSGIRSSDAAANPAAYNGFAVGGFSDNDMTTAPGGQAKATWSYYGECYRAAGAPALAWVQCMELDVINRSGGTAGSVNPYDAYTNATSYGLILASGKPGISVTDATVALHITNNTGGTTGGHFTTGIDINATSITGTDGVTGTGSAIKMAKGHQVEWWYAGAGTGSLATRIRSDVSTAAGRQELRFDNNGFWLRSINSASDIFNVDTAGVINATNNMVLNYSPDGTASIEIGNANVGTSASAQFIASANSGSAIFGAAGSNYTTISAIQNQAFILAPSALAGIALYNEGANPTRFYASGADVGGFNAAGAWNVSSSGTFGTFVSVGTKLRAVGAAPAPTSCGTSPSVEGSDLSGTVTMGTASPTGCVLTFAAAYTAAPRCTVSWRSNLASMQYTVSNTALTLTQTATSSNLVDYICTARTGG